MSLRKVQIAGNKINMRLNVYHMRLNVVEHHGPNIRRLYHVTNITSHVTDIVNTEYFHTAKVFGVQYEMFLISILCVYLSDCVCLDVRLCFRQCGSVGFFWFTLVSIM